MNSTTPPRGHVTPARLLTDLNFAAKIWFGLFLLLAFCEAATLLLLLRPRTVDPRRVIFVASNGRGYEGETRELAALTNLHVRAAEDATFALLNRRPNGFDQPERIGWLFLPEAAAQARAQAEEKAPERRARQLREKPEISRLQYLEVSPQRILIAVLGQRIQAGAFNGQPFAEVVPFQLDLELVPNPNLAMNAAFPLVVQRFKYETRHP